MRPFFIVFTAFSLVAFGFLTAPRSAAAQASPPPLVRTYTVVGTVVDTLGRPVPGALVVIDAVRQVVADGEGRFAVRNLEPANFFLVNAKRIGYGEAYGEVFPDANGVAQVRVELVPGVVTLGAVKVSADRVTPFSRFEAHRTMARGAFFDPVDIRERQPLQLSDMLRGVNWVQLVRQGAHLVPMGRRPTQGSCELSLVVNGVYRRLTEPGDFDRIAGSIDQIRAIEVYARSSDVPAEYIFESDMLQCGLVAIWTAPGARFTTKPDSASTP